MQPKHKRMNMICSKIQYYKNYEYINEINELNLRGSAAFYVKFVFHSNLLNLLSLTLRLNVSFFTYLR